VLAHIHPDAPRNLACGYCNEYRSGIQAVPLEEMQKRLDKLADAGHGYDFRGETDDAPEARSKSCGIFASAE